MLPKKIHRFRESQLIWIGRSRLQSSPISQVVTISRAENKLLASNGNHVVCQQEISELILPLIGRSSWILTISTLPITCSCGPSFASLKSQNDREIPNPIFKKFKNLFISFSPLRSQLTVEEYFEDAHRLSLIRHGHHASFLELHFISEYVKYVPPPPTTRREIKKQYQETELGTGTETEIISPKCSAGP